MPDKLYHECQEVISQGRAVLEDLRNWGIAEVYTSPTTSVDRDGRAAVDTPAAPGDIETLQELEAGLQGCRLCTLCEQRNKIVFGSGNPHADLVLVGEAPGREEDLQGYPFVGEAGQLLERILFAMKLSRDDVYICNVVKCRPPGNRDPEPAEIASCEPFLKRQLALIQPQIIVALGRFAAQELLKSRTPISRLRGHWQEYQGIPLMPTFHPAYLLRSPGGKREVWHDMKQVMQKLQH